MLCYVIYTCLRGRKRSQHINKHKKKKKESLKAKFNANSADLLSKKYNVIKFLT